MTGAHGTTKTALDLEERVDRTDQDVDRIFEEAVRLKVQERSLQARLDRALAERAAITRRITRLYMAAELGGLKIGDGRRT